MNYRSVVILGRATVVENREEKLSALFALSEHMVPGRWNDVREPTEAELRQTTVLSVPISEASAKIRSGPPLDDEEDYELDVWAGVIPLRLVADSPVADSQMDGTECPQYALKYARPERNKPKSDK